MPLNTASAEVALRDLTHIFDTTIKETPAFYPNLCTVLPSDGEDEKYGMLGSIPGVREWLGDRQFNELRAADFVLANKLWEDSLEILKTKLADDRMGMYKLLMPSLAKRAAQHPDKLLLQAMINGETQACWDGQLFYDTDHAWGESGAQSNDLTYAAATGTVPTVEEFKAAFRQAVSALLGFKDDSGEPLIQPVIEGGLSDLLVVVPLTLRAIANDAIESVLLSNSTNVVIDRPKIVTNTFAWSSGEKFTVNYVGDMLKPFVFQEREPISRQMKGLDDFETKSVKFMTQARYNVGYLAWWNSVLTTFT